MIEEPKKQPKTFGEALAGHLTKAHMTQNKLASKIDYTASQISKWKGGRPAPFNAIEPIAEALHLGVDEQLQLYELAGFTLPKWSMPQEEEAYHGGMKSDEWKAEKLGSMTDLYGRVAEALRSAQTSVCDLTWGPGVDFYSDEEEEAFNAYTEEIYRACERKVT